MNALIETSIPTLALLYATQMLTPAYAVLLPPTFVYFIFIILSALRLDVRLCVFTVLWQAWNTGSGHLLSGRIAHWGHGSSTNILGLARRALGLLARGRRRDWIVTRQIKRQLTASFEAQQERNRIAEIFGQHVSPQVVDKLLGQNAEVLSESRHVCMMFLDIRDFTRFAQNRKPEEVVNYLNLVFGFMIDTINEHDGIINKFLGDGFMAVFGAPLSSTHDVRNAAHAALKIVERLRIENEAGRIPPTRIGIAFMRGWQSQVM